MSAQQSQALLRGVSTWLGDQIRIPHVVMTFLSFLSPLSFQGDLLGTAELPSLCNVVSSIYQRFVPHFAMAVYMFIQFILHYRMLRSEFKE